MNETSLKQSDFIAAQPNPWRPWVAASIAAIAILGVAIGLMALLGLFKAPQNDTGTKSLAAALGLVGAVLSAVVALVGTIIKYSIDDRNARQADIDASRNYTLALQAEQRNRIEAAIRAVDLLSENNQDATKTQMGGALLALVSLGEMDLAISLLSQLWPTGKATPAVAGSMLVAALKSNSEQTQVATSIVLYQNASRIAQTGYDVWPLSYPSWREDLYTECRLGLVLAAAEWLVSVKPERNTLPEAAVVLYQALDDSGKNIANIAAACLRPVVKALAGTAWTDYSGLKVTVGQISDRLAKHGAPSFTNYEQKYEAQVGNLYAVLIAERAQGDPSKEPRKA